MRSFFDSQRFALSYLSYFANVPTHITVSLATSITINLILAIGLGWKISQHSRHLRAASEFTECSDNDIEPFPKPNQDLNSGCVHSAPTANARGSTNRSNLERNDSPSAQHNTNDQGFAIRSCVPEDFDAPLTGEVPKLNSKRSLSQSIPFDIPCVIQITLNGIPFQRCAAFSILWQAPSQYQQCIRNAERFLQTTLSEEVTHTSVSFYRVSHQYRVHRYPTLEFSKHRKQTSISDILAEKDNRSPNQTQGERNFTSENTAVDSEAIPDPNAWAERVPIKLASCFLAEPSVPLALELNLSYTTFEPHSATCTSKNCFKDISKALLQKKVLIWDKDDWFVPSWFLREFFTRDTIEHLVRQYDWSDITGKPADLTSPSEDKAFVSYIDNWGVHLLATIIFAGLDLAFLHKLWKANIKEKDMPLSLPNRPESIEEGEFEKFRRYQSSFKAHNFPDSQKPTELGKHEDILDRVLVPVTSKTHIGKGANGDVYQVQIQEEHHNFSPDRNSPLAMKVLKRDEPDSPYSRHELEILKTLAEVPHPHLTPFYGSWRHRGVFHMLFPLAKCDLYRFLSETTAPPDLEGPFVLWAISQMHGLAGALNHIHNLSPVGLDSSQEFRDGTNTLRTGVHLDLSLKNVLVFPFENSYGVLKISDFGTAKIRQMLSGDFRPKGSPRFHDHKGNAQYAAPEGESGEEVGRPYDIFSLGCIYLDFLLWVFGKGDAGSVTAFQFERQQSEQQEPGRRDCAFYYKNGTDIGLKRPVQEKLRWLKDEAGKRPRFKRVFRLIVCEVERMISIEQQSRPLAASVESTLKHLGMEADLEISNPGVVKMPRYLPPSLSGKLSASEEPPRHETHLHPQDGMRRGRSGSRGSLHSRRGSLSIQIPSSPTNVAPSALTLGFTGGAAVDGVRDQANIDSPALQIEVTDHSDSAVSATTLTPASALLQHMRDQDRPGHTVRRSSDPRRVQTLP